MQVIPLQAVPSQIVAVTLGGQQCNISVYQKRYDASASGSGPAVYVDLYVSGNLVIGGVIAQNLNLIVRSLYLGFSGDLVFYDTSGAGSDPVYTGLGSQFVFLYLTPADVASGVAT